MSKAAVEGHKKNITKCPQIKISSCVPAFCVSLCKGCCVVMKDTVVAVPVVALIFPFVLPVLVQLLMRKS